MKYLQILWNKLINKVIDLHVSNIPLNSLEIHASQYPVQLPHFYLGPDDSGSMAAGRYMVHRL